MPNNCWYEVASFGATVAQNQRILTSIKKSYQVQMFNGKQHGEPGPGWTDMEESLTDLSAKYPSVLFCVSYRFLDDTDDETTEIYFGNGRRQENQPEVLYDSISPELLGVGMDSAKLPADCLCNGRICVTGANSQFTITPEFEDGELVLAIRDKKGFVYTPVHTGIEVFGGQRPNNFR